MSNDLLKLKMGSILKFEVKFDLEGQGQLPPKTIGIFTKVFCFSGPNLAILAWISDELSWGQASDWYTHRHRQRQYLEAKTDLGKKKNIVILGLTSVEYWDRVASKPTSPEIIQHVSELQRYCMQHIYVSTLLMIDGYHMLSMPNTYSVQLTLFH